MDNIAFDFDGVIANTDEFKRKWFLNNTNIFLKKVDKTNIFRDLSKYYKKAEINYLYNEMAAEVFKKDILVQTKPMDDNIGDYLEQLRKNHKLLIITKRPNDMLNWINDWLSTNEIGSYFDKIISSANTKKYKIALNNNVNILVDDDISNLSNKNIPHNLLFNSALIKNWNQLFNYINKIEERKIISFFGLPGSGKSTFMNEFTDYTKISSAQLLIDNGVNVKDGNLIKDTIINKLMLEKIRNTNNNIILDGYPRTTNQLNYLIENGIIIDDVYNIITPYNEIIARIENRLTCINCHESYTISEYKKPKITGVCDICGHKLVRRNDDDYNIYKERIDCFIEKTLPLLEYYKNQKISVIDVDGLNYEIIDKNEKINIGILWNTMSNIFDDVINELKKFGQIVDYFDVELEKKLENFIWEVYGKETEIVKKHVERKINYTVNLDDSRIVRIVFLKTSKNPKDIKKYIRNLFSVKIPIYDYDNTFHLTENNDENILVLKALKNNILNNNQILKNDSHVRTMKKYI